MGELNEIYSKLMKPINGCMIEKTAEINLITGKIKPETIIYTVYSDENFDGVVNCFHSLQNAQACAKNYRKGE